MGKDYGIVSLTSGRKVVSVLELTVWIAVCAVAVFGWSEAMNSNQILPKQYYTLMTVSVAVIVLAVKVLIGKRIRLDFGSMSVVISAICTVEAIYALCQWADWVVPNMTYRVTGHFDNPAGLVACLCVGISFSLYQYGRIPTKVVCICLSIIFVAISISKSRTGIIAALALLVDFALRLRGVNVRRRIAVIIVVATALIVVGYFLKRDSADGRMLIWLCSWNMLCDSPWTGHGIDAFRRLYMEYQADWLVSHPSKFILSIILTAIFSTFYSCQNEELIDNEYADMPYLFLPQNTDLSNLSDDDILIILEARPRMCIFENEDGLMELKPRNGREVNVSENIYEFYVRMVKESNEMLLSEVSISRSGQINSSEGGSDGYNCMAHAISGATGIPFSTVDSTLASEFRYYQGNGILINDFYKATSLFNGPKGGA